MDKAVARDDEGCRQWFRHMDRMENDRIAKMVYVKECAGSRSVVRLQKRWIDTVKVCLKKRGLDVRQARKMVDRSVWQGFDLDKMPQPYEALEGRKSVCGQA